MSAVHFLLLLLCLSLSPPSLSLTEVEALIAFKKSLSDPSGKLSSWTPNSDPCKWEGIFCESGPVIIRLHLQDMGLSGSIDVDSLAQIRTLISLSFSNNLFSGPIPPFNKLTSLKALYLASNKFSGEIPADYFVGTTFRRLWLSDNGFSGKIPESLSKLDGLINLHLEGNKFTGPIPDLSQKSLMELNLSRNQLEGEIPGSMERFGANAFKENSGICGKFVGSDCKGRNGKSSKKTIMVILVIVAAMVILLIFLISAKSKNKGPNDFRVLEKEPVDDVVEVQVHGNSGGSGSGRDVGGGGSKHDRVSGSHGGGGASTKKSEDFSSHKKRSEQGSRKGSQSGRNGMGDLVMINFEKGTFGMADLMKAAAEVLGNGGLGSAYKAVMSNGVAVVVKRIKEMNNLAKEEFDAEIRRIGNVRHKNILTPLAYHYRKEEKLVISEYVSKGSLLYLLHGDRGICHAQLNWPTRLKIIKGITSGMQHLHDEFSSYEIPHGNLKSSNVLINDSYDPLLTDYAFIRMVSPTQAVQGMFAFKSPEVIESQQISPKCDVYCLGIIILEVLIGKFPSQYLNAGKGGTDVIQWVRSAIQDKKEAEFLDPEITSTTNSLDPMIQLLHVGAACCESDPNRRPCLKEVITRIEEIHP